MPVMAEREIVYRVPRRSDAERWHALRRQAFVSTAAFDAAAYATIDPDRAVVAEVDGTMCAVMVTLPFEQTWGWRRVPCGGLSGVTVAPEARGLGLAKEMLRRSLLAMRDRGDAISALYPTTASLYRSAGYEIAGWWTTRRVDLADIAAPSEELRWRATAIDHADVVAVHDAMAARSDGWVLPDRSVWARTARVLSEPAVNRYCYVGYRGDVPAATLRYRYVETTDAMYRLDVELVAGIDTAAVGGALAFAAGNGTTARSLHTTLPVAELLPHVAHPQRTAPVSDWPWMLRIVDPHAAIAARGFPAPVRGSVDLLIADEVVEANAGYRQLHIEDGVGRLDHGGDGRVQVDITTLAQLYAGTDPGLLFSHGRLVGATPEDLDLLASAFVTTPSAHLFF